MSDLPAVDRPAIVACSIEAALRYRIPLHVLLAVATQENGRPGLRVKNANGSSDIGTLQFNTRYIRSLAPYGIAEEHVAATGCYPYHLAAWRLHGHLLRDTGDLWTRAANYHSRTPHLNQAYRQKLIHRSAEWTSWLQRSGTGTPRAQPEPSVKAGQGIRPLGPYVPRTVAASAG